MARQRILMLCTANICRSPMAAALWAAESGERGRRILVSSAGLDAQPGQPADNVCIELLALRGIDLAQHRSTRFSMAAAADLDLILVMENRHAQRVTGAVPTLIGRVHLLGRWGAGEIADPHGGPREDYEKCLVAVEQSVGQWLDRMR